MNKKYIKELVCEYVLNNYELKEIVKIVRNYDIEIVSEDLSSVTAPILASIIRNSKNLYKVLMFDFGITSEFLEENANKIYSDYIRNFSEDLTFAAKIKDLLYEYLYNDSKIYNSKIKTPKISPEYGTIKNAIKKSKDFYKIILVDNNITIGYLLQNEETIHAKYVEEAMKSESTKELLYKYLCIKGMLDKVNLNIRSSVKEINTIPSKYSPFDFDINYVEKLYYRGNVLDKKEFTKNYYDGYPNEEERASDGVYFTNVRSSIINSNKLYEYIMRDYDITVYYLIEHKDEINKLYDEMQTQDQNQNGNQKKMV